MKVYDKTYSHNDILQKDVKDAKKIILKTHVIYIYIYQNCYNLKILGLIYKRNLVLGLT